MTADERIEKLLVDIADAVQMVASYICSLTYTIDRMEIALGRLTKQAKCSTYAVEQSKEEHSEEEE